MSNISTKPRYFFFRSETEGSSNKTESNLFFERTYKKLRKLYIGTLLTSIASEIVAVYGTETIGREGFSLIKVLMDVSSSNCSMDFGCAMLLILSCRNETNKK